VQTVAMGLLIVVLDVPPTGYDWIADPLGWILVLLGLAAVKDVLPNYRGLSITGWVCLAVSVLTWPADSVATIDDSLGWVFSLPEIAWCFLMCDALHDVSEGGRRMTLLWLRNLFPLVGVLPALIYGGGLNWLTTPAAVFAVAANVALIYLLWTAEEGSEAEEGTGAEAAAAIRARNEARSATRAAADGARSVASGAKSAAGTAKSAAGRTADRVWPWQTPERVAEREKKSRSGSGRTGAGDSGSGITGAEVVAKVRKRRENRPNRRSS